MAKQIPARVKYRKMHRGSRAGIAWKGSDVSFGEYGLQGLDRAWITTRQIEACRQTITRKMKMRARAGRTAAGSLTAARSSRRSLSSCATRSSRARSRSGSARGAA